MLYAEGKYDDALKLLSAAADAEDKTEKHPVTPGPLAPARELYGAMLLDRGMAKEALAAYEAVLKKEPNRLDAYIGAAKSASKADETAKAKQYTAKVISLTENADTVRPEVTELRASKFSAVNPEQNVRQEPGWLVMSPATQLAHWSLQPHEERHVALVWAAEQTAIKSDFRPA